MVNDNLENNLQACWDNSFEELTDSEKENINAACTLISSLLSKDGRKVKLSQIRKYAITHPDEFPFYTKWIWKQLLRIRD